MAFLGKAGIGHRLDVFGQTGVLEFRLWKSLLQRGDDTSQIWLWWQVVTPVVQ